MSKKSILDMSAIEAKDFFLEQKTYCNINLPEYFNFSNILKKLDEKCNEYSNISDLYNFTKLKESENVNYTLYANKDGNLSWRPLQIIHPFVYLVIVREITENGNWNKLLERFRKFQENSKIKCLSIPVKSETHQSDQAEQILQWWEGVEQESINLSLEYEYMFDTDIADCYGSIYTHSIAWAVETKEVAKQQKNTKSLLGNKIDSCIQMAQYGQTNGIPQGSVLMDFIAEIVLGYVDELLLEKIKDINDYQILRYRDDYRIFVNDPNVGKTILKSLSEILIPFGLKLNSSKTKETENVIVNSVKKDKLEWLKFEWLNLKVLKLQCNKDEVLDFRIKETFHNSQKKMLLIYQHSLEYPNSGSIVKALSEFNKQIDDNESSIQIICILVDLMKRNPKTIPISCSIISKILKNIKNPLKLEISTKIHKKLKNSPNSELAQIWLQRMLKDSLQHFEFDDKLCKIVKQDVDIELWNNEWLDKNSKIKTILKTNSIFDKSVFDKMSEEIDNREVDIFYNNYFLGN
ncbi:RNA-directed DNA polymerase [Capnocytophaga felis]|uniref:Reverse transcriptase domain-containing protein n=1 Tax=Capnocytophaga felis TaxID=2267611 RepID=A0A5M4BBH8_9FLAO|nr:RNA-directed DNA polymerase [Capnocytophaga felis]GET46597.1 hypothetical protein RCZ01_18990 [Capnocytophaga felis]GET49071.1 hypothetical protein RCZ02_19020 [Capnocytophaga felis]